MFTWMAQWTCRARKAPGTNDGAPSLVRKRCLFMRVQRHCLCAWRSCQPWRSCGSRSGSLLLVEGHRRCLQGALRHVGMWVALPPQGTGHLWKYLHTITLRDDGQNADLFIERLKNGSWCYTRHTDRAPGRSAPQILSEQLQRRK